MVNTVQLTRNLAIDRFRGALVILMVCGDYLAGVQFVPAFLKHAPDIGFTVADTVASAFVFTIGLNFGTSFARHLREGTSAAYLYFALRYLSLIGIGAVISAAATVTGHPTDWGVLQAIGVAGLVSMLFIRLPTWARFAIGVAMLCGYQCTLDASMLQPVLGSVHGGIFGALSWAALLVLSTAVADVWRRGLPAYAVCCTFLIISAAVSVLFIPVSKHRVSMSFILSTLALSAVVFLIVDQLARKGSPQTGILCWWGENAIVLYLVHLLVLAVFVVPPTPWWYEQAPLWLAGLQLLGILAVMTAVAWWLHLRKTPEKSERLLLGA